MLPTSSASLPACTAANGNAAAEPPSPSEAIRADMAHGAAPIEMAVVVPAAMANLLEHGAIRDGRLDYACRGQRSGGCHLRREACSGSDGRSDNKGFEIHVVLPGGRWPPACGCVLVQQGWQKRGAELTVRSGKRRDVREIRRRADDQGARAPPRVWPRSMRSARSLASLRPRPSAARMTRIASIFRS